MLRRLHRNSAIRESNSEEIKHGKKENAGQLRNVYVL
jgi:hypothetical protein